MAYLRRTSGLRPTQITRLVARWNDNRLADVPLAKRYHAPAAPFARKYTAIDIELLVEMDRANEDVGGPAVVHLLRRAYHVYGDKDYERLAGLSVSHLYNLRKSAGYQAQRTSFTKTRPVCNLIGVRKPPRSNRRAGWVRIDSVLPKAISMASRGSTTSPVWMRQANGTLRPACRASARHFCCPC